VTMMMHPAMNMILVEHVSELRAPSITGSPWVARDSQHSLQRWKALFCREAYQAVRRLSRGAGKILSGGGCSAEFRVYGASSFRDPRSKVNDEAEGRWPIVCQGNVVQISTTTIREMRQSVGILACWLRRQPRWHPPHTRRQTRTTLAARARACLTSQHPRSR